MQKEYLRSNWCFLGESCVSVGKVSQSRRGLQKNSLQEHDIDIPPDASEHIERFIHPKESEAELIICTKKTMQMKN